MIKLPARQDGNWTVQFANDKLPDLVATRNLTFDKEGYLRLSKPTVSYYSSADDADFLLPLAQAQVFSGAYFVLTRDAVFELDFFSDGASSFTGGRIRVAQDTSTDTPLGDTISSRYSDATFFNDDWCVINTGDGDLYKHPLGSYSNSWSIETGVSSFVTISRFSACNFLNQNNLAIGNDNDVDLLNTSYTQPSPAETVIPSDFVVTGVAYNNGFVGFTTYHEDGFRGAFWVWDGNTAEANYTIELTANGCYCPAPYGNGFVFIDSNGVLHYWTPNQTQILAALPMYYSSAVLMAGSSGPVNHAIVTEGELIHINLDSSNSAVDENYRYFRADQPGGIWTYDPAVGLYHRHAVTATKITAEAIATTSVDTTDDEITVTAAPETGTPTRYSRGGSSGTVLEGLENRGLYYAIKVDATTIKLASTYQDAVDGNEIDLTGTGNNNQTLQFYPKRDFGQSLNYGPAGMLFNETEKNEYCCQNTLTPVYAGGYVLEDSENRGHFITSKFMSAELQEDWQKVYIKHSPLVSDLDKINVKYRITNNNPIVSINSTTAGNVTWTDSDTFTTTDTQWANVQVGDEVEFVEGTGSGYLAHITSITEDAGTYTVNIDETIKNLTASDTGTAVVSRWKKLTTLDNGIISNDDGFSEIAVGVKSKQIQFKIELRGEDVEIEEILVAHQLHKPVG